MQLELIKRKRKRKAGTLTITKRGSVRPGGVAAEG